MKNGFVISLDFELFWGSTDTMTISDFQVQKFRATRLAIPRLLDLFEQYNIASTWATVGFLFAQDAKEIWEEYSDHLPLYEDSNLSTYERLKLINDEYEDCYFAPDIIADIATRAKQEISTHTFSHFYALDAQGNKEAFSVELMKSQKIAQNKNGLLLRSIVYPRNQVCNIDQLREHGVDVYRGNPSAKAYQSGTTSQGRDRTKRLYRLVDRYIPLTKGLVYDINEVQEHEEIINVPASRFLAPIMSKLNSLEKLRLFRIKKEMTMAAKQNKTYHLWWHPHNMGIHTDQYFKFLEKILIHYVYLSAQYGWQSYNMLDFKN